LISSQSIHVTKKREAVCLAFLVRDVFARLNASNGSRRIDAEIIIVSVITSELDFIHWITVLILKAILLARGGNVKNPHNPFALVHLRHHRNNL